MTSPDTPPQSWQKSLYTLLIAQFFVMIGFSFVFPFMPLFIEKIGNFDTRQVAFWAGTAEGASR
jgi:predicted MFS family arabinose efflux permease